MLSKPRPFAGLHGGLRGRSSRHPSAPQRWRLRTATQKGTSLYGTGMTMTIRRGLRAFTWYDPESGADMTADVVISGETLASAYGVSDTIYGGELYSWDAEAAPQPVVTPWGVAGSPYVRRNVFWASAGRMDDCIVPYRTHFGDVFFSLLLSNYGSAFKQTFALSAANSAAATGLGGLYFYLRGAAATAEAWGAGFVSGLLVNVAFSTRLPNAADVNRELRRRFGCAENSKIIFWIQQPVLADWRQTIYRGQKREKVVDRSGRYSANRMQTALQVLAA